MDNGLITFIIVTWNNEKQIEACLESLTQYTTVSHEIIIVDNVSRDRTCDIITRKYPLVQLIKKQRKFRLRKGKQRCLKKG